MLFDRMHCLLGLAGWCPCHAASPGMPLSGGNPVIQIILDILNSLPLPSHPPPQYLLLCKVFPSQVSRCSSSSTSERSMSLPVLPLSCSPPIVYSDVLPGRTRHKRAGILYKLGQKCIWLTTADGEIHVCHRWRDRRQMSKGRKLE